MNFKIMTLVFASAMFMASCGAENNTPKEETTTSTEPEVEVVENQNIKYFYQPEATQISYTAFKTNSKIGVGGSFNEFEVSNVNQGATSIAEAFENATFTISTASSTTGNDDRDTKIGVNIFGNFIDSNIIAGNVYNITSVANDGGTAVLNIKMNGVAHEVDASYHLNSDTLTLNATIDITNWNGNEAFDALNEVCKVLHTGDDGVSKLWYEVDVQIQTVLRTE